MSEELGAHIRCGRRDAAPYAILPGDPGRIDHIARHLNDVREIAYNREFRSIRGTYQAVSYTHLIPNNHILAKQVCNIL